MLCVCPLGPLLAYMTVSHRLHFALRALCNSSGRPVPLSTCTGQSHIADVFQQGLQSLFSQVLFGHVGSYIYALVGVWVASVLFGLCLGAYIGDLPQTERLLGESQIAVFELNLSHNIIDVHLDQA